MKASAVIKRPSEVSGAIGSPPSLNANVSRLGGASVTVDPALDGETPHAECTVQCNLLCHGTERGSGFGEHGNADGLQTVSAEKNALWLIASIR